MTPNSRVHRDGALPEVGAFVEEQILSVKISKVGVKVKMFRGKLNSLAVKTSQKNVEEAKTELQ